MPNKTKMKKHQSPLVQAAAAAAAAASVGGKVGTNNNSNICPTSQKTKKKKKSSSNKKKKMSTTPSNEVDHDHDNDTNMVEYSKKQIQQQQQQQQIKHHHQHHKRKRSQKDLDDEAEERRLTAVLFGGGHEQQHHHQVSPPSLLHSDSDDDDDDDDDEQPEAGIARNEDPSRLFELDTQGDVDVEEYDDDDDNHDDNHDDDDKKEEEDGEDSASDEPAWVDDDDVEIDMMKTNRLKKLRTHRDEQVSALKGKDFEQRLRKRFQSTTMITARTDWATLDQTMKTKTDDQDDEEPEQTSAAPLLASSAYGLPPHVLQVVRCPDANQSDPSQAAIQATHFHPGSDPDRPLMLAAGLDKTLRFFQVNADGSDKIHGIHFPKLPIYSAQFLGNTGNVVVSGRRSFFYIYDAAAGKLDLVPRIMGREEKSLERCTTSPDGKTIAFLGNDGYIILVDAKSKQWMMDLKMNGSARAVTFTPNSDYLIASGSDGDVYRFDLRTRQCVERFASEDGGITSSLSSSFKHLAVGSESGVVNLYSDRPRHNNNNNNKPIKSLMNLQTSSDLCRFNDDGSILAFSSRREKNSLKLLHVPTATVFSNWPTSKTPLNYVWSIDFSPESKFLSIGNDKGNCLLYKLLHYHE